MPTKVLPLFGTCVPSSCSIVDASIFAQNILKLLELENQTNFQVLDCFTNNKSNLNAGQIMMMFVCNAIKFPMLNYHMFQLRQNEFDVFNISILKF